MPVVEPLYLGYTTLYANENFLNKYNKTIPKTWNELLSTSKYILESERKLNNTEFMAYNGLYDDSESASCSLYDFIYSFRHSVSSKTPKITSQEAIDSLTMLKKLKNEVGLENSYAVGKLLMDGNALFIKFLKFLSPISEIIEHNHFKEVLLPGNIKGITGETIVGYNIGIIDGLDPDKKKACIEILKYMTSKETHKIFLLNNQIISGINSLYDDEDVCKIIDCELRKNLQFVGRPKYTLYSYDEYSEKYRKKIYEFLYGDRKAKDVLRDIENLSKIFYISFDTRDSYVGIIFINIISLTSVLMLFSLLFLIPENYGPFFEFLPNNLWILVVLGSIIIQCSSFTMLNELTEFKCGIKSFMLSIVIIGSYYVDNILIEDGKNFQKCLLNGYFGIITRIILFLYEGFIILVMNVLVFIEWNIQSMHSDIKFSSIASYISVLTTILYFMLNLAQINNYAMYFIIKESIISLMAISNYIFLYGYRLLFAFADKQNLKLVFINTINKNFVNNESTMDTKSKSNEYNNSKSCTYNKSNIKKSHNMNDSNETSNNEYTNDENNSSNRRTSIFTKIINYHYTLDYMDDEDNNPPSISYETKLDNIAE
ncbi:hypothetical protein PIROE2DRAFT_2134, partial [Piromyces sp. E2]